MPEIVLSPASSPVPTRLVSLDAFRGFTIAAMLLVNNPGDWSHLYRQLGHAEWHGWTFTDWVFPFFLFICGVSMTLSLSRKSTAEEAKVGLMLSLWKRAAIIFAIGLALNFIPNFNFETLRIPGVLQRIALCTFFAAPIVIFFSWREQWVWIASLLGLYTVLMLFVPVPDLQGRVGVGVLEPGRDFAAYVDRLFLEGHMWAKSKVWDPEGIITTIPALCSLLLGTQLGYGLQSGYAKADKTVWMLLAGLLALLIGQILDVSVMPINKNLWTLSYCIFMTGWALIVFAAFYWLIDANGDATLRKNAARLLSPFTIFGMNALFIFALSGLIAKIIGAITFTQNDGAVVTLKAVLYAPIKALGFSPVNSSLLFAILFCLGMFVIAWWMWKRNWFIKV